MRSNDILNSLIQEAKEKHRNLKNAVANIHQAINGLKLKAGDPLIDAAIEVLQQSLLDIDEAL